MRIEWFINEDLGVYPYDPAKQQADFPNDFPLGFDTEADAVAEADRMWEWETSNSRMEF
jgi:hypothetical protein